MTWASLSVTRFGTSQGYQSVWVVTEPGAPQGQAPDNDDVLPYPAVSPLLQSAGSEGATGFVTVNRAGAWRVDVAAFDATDVLFRDRPLDATNPPSAPLPPLTDAQREEIRRIWASAALFYEPTQPGSPERIEILRAELAQAGVTLPPQLAELLSISDGAVALLGDISTEGIDYPLNENVRLFNGEADPEESPTYGCDLFSAFGVLSAWRMWNERMREHAYLDEPPRSIPTVQRARLRNAQRGWVPFAVESDMFFAIDTVPGPEGTPGQVILMPADYDGVPSVEANSLIDFMLHREIDEEPRGRKAWVKTVATVGAGDDLAAACGPQLRELTLQDVGAIDLTPLAGHPTLAFLTVDGHIDPTGVEALASLAALERVKFTDSAHSNALLPIAQALGSNPLLRSVDFDGSKRPLSERLQIIRAMRPNRELPVWTLTGHADER